MRDIADLPKADLHLHLTGSMRVATMRELAGTHGLVLDESRGWPEKAVRDWETFQFAYEHARQVIRSAEDVQRVIGEAAVDGAASGAAWIEMQIDPTSYAPFLGGYANVVTVAAEAARRATEETSCGVGIVVAGSWARPAGHAEMLAKLAADHAGDHVVGFGMSNDERRGRVPEFARAFGIVREAGLKAVPHAGSLLGPDHTHETWLIEDQVPRVVRLARLGHKRKDVDDNYSHVTDVMIARMLAGLQRRWEEDGDGPGSGKTGRQRHERLGIANVFIRPCSPFAPRNDKRPADGIHRQAV